MGWGGALGNVVLKLCRPWGNYFLSLDLKSPPLEDEMVGFPGMANRFYLEGVLVIAA